MLTNQEVQEACEKFIAYLRANQRRPIAMVIEVCNDYNNTELTATYGMNDVLDETCLKVMCGLRGYKLEFK